MDRIVLVADENSQGTRIDAFISENTELSRNSVQLLIENKNITVNQKSVLKSYKLSSGDVIEVCIPLPVETQITAENIPLDIYYEDNDLLVVNKPKGMVVHPANGNESRTLVNALMYHCKDSLSGINGEIRPGIVHRIDKDTSGLLVVAKNDIVHEKLAIQFKNHSIKRVYNSICYGVIKEDSGYIEQPIGRDKLDRKKFCVTQTNSKYAYTSYNVLERLKGYTLTENILRTGRTHQIRVHMRFIHHPLAGDEIYGPKKIIKELKGQALHAGVLGFIHPVSGEYLEFNSPWSEEFKNFYNKVKE